MKNNILIFLIGSLFTTCHCEAQLSKEDQSLYKELLPQYLSDSRTLCQPKLRPLAQKPVLTSIDIACLSHYSSEQVLSVYRNQIQVQTNGTRIEKVFMGFNQLIGDAIPYTTNTIQMRSLVIRAYETCSNRVPYLLKRFSTCDTASALDFINAYCSDLDPALCGLYVKIMETNTNSDINLRCQELLLRNGGFSTNAGINLNDLAPLSIFSRYQGYIANKYHLAHVDESLASYLLLQPNNDGTGTIVGGASLELKSDLDRFILFRIATFAGNK